MTAALRQAARGAGRSMRRGDEAVPAPQIAFARHQTLAGFERSCELGSRLAVDHANLRQPARQLRGRLHESGQSLRALRQRRIAAGNVNFRPVHRRRSIDRRVEIIAERCAERLFVAFVDRDVIDHRRPQIAGLEREHLRQGFGFGFQPLHALFGFGQRFARGFEIGARVGVRGLGGDGGSFRLGQRGLRAFDRGGQRGAVGGFQRGQFALDFGNLGGDAGGAFALLARGVLVLMALRGEIGERGGQVGENLLGGGEFAVGLGHFGVDAAAAAGAFACFLANRVFLGGELCQRRFGVGREPGFALAVGGELLEAQIELGDAVLGARLLAVEVLQRDVEPVQRCARARLGLAQFGQ